MGDCQIEIDRYDLDLAWPTLRDRAQIIGLMLKIAIDNCAVGKSRMLLQ